MKIKIKKQCMVFKKLNKNVVKGFLHWESFYLFLANFYFIRSPFSSLEFWEFRPKGNVDTAWISLFMSEFVAGPYPDPKNQQIVDFSDLDTYYNSCTRSYNQTKSGVSVCKYKKLKIAPDKWVLFFRAIAFTVILEAVDFYFLKILDAT